MPSPTVEDYLKRLILAQHASGQATIATGQLAAAMGVVPGTVTTMLKALAESGLVDYESRHGARLTPRGEHLALHVLRRHRLVELFLVRVLGLDWSVVHQEAEALEHVISDAVLERIDALLGRPTVDPHGDPIPTQEGRLSDPVRPSLVECPVGKAQRIARVLDQSPEFLRFAERHGLVPGARVTVTRREPAAAATVVRVAPRRAVSLGVSAAAKILVDR